jgi:hypothetical protein
MVLKRLTLAQSALFEKFNMKIGRRIRFVCKPRKIRKTINYAYSYQFIVFYNQKVKESTISSAGHERVVTLKDFNKF